MSAKQAKPSRRRRPRDPAGGAATEAERASGSARGERSAAAHGRDRVFFAIAALLPFVALALLEAVLRLALPDPTRPAFVTAPFAEAYRMANPRVTGRYFVGEASPPSPQPEPFAARKPDRSFRVFVLGESSTAGFPYPRNGSFSRLLRDALSDVLPEDSVEVINLGIAATNSYTLLDLAGEIADERPDAVLIYAGHNEYYGALGVGSRQSALGGSPVLIRAYLTLLRLRMVSLLRTAIARMAGGAAAGGDAAAASFMEVLARDRRIELGSDRYQRGVLQYEGNLSRVVHRLRDGGAAVFVASLASNLRDQPPLVAAANDAPGAARAVFDSARAALARGDTAAARTGFARARDLDVVRFRAPGEFDGVVRRVAATSGATYVPVAESFAAAAPGGSPGRELFLEHVHPNRRGVVLLAREFFEAIRSAGFLGRAARPDRLRGWEDYERRAALTPFDERIAHHTVATLAGRWPFVAEARAIDYRGTYRPAGLVDSLALLVSRGGIAWQEAKLRVAADYETRAQIDSAASEYRGLTRDMPLAEVPWRLLGRALLAGGLADSAAVALERAMALRPTSYTAFALGTIAVQKGDLARGIGLLERAVSLDRTDRAALYQLSLAYGLARNLSRAREAAMRLYRLDPRYPGLAEWLATLGKGG